MAGPRARHFLRLVSEQLD